MKKAKALPRVWSWFQGAMKDLWGFVSQIPTLALNAFKSLTFADIVVLPSAFAKIAGVFGSFLGKFLSWAGNAAWKLAEIVFDVVSPGAFGYVKKTGAALKSILKNPLPFVGNLVKAAKAGFQSFAGGFLGHLKAGLIDWLTGSLPGVYIPKGFSLGELVKFAFSVLGISWASVRGKLVKVLGESTVKAMETGFDIVKKLVTQGPAAAWEHIKEALGNLKSIVIDGIIGFVVDTIKVKAIPKLIAMFIPGAGFISAILSIYDTVKVFVQKISKIIQVVTGFIDSIVSIAGGNIAGAAKRVEGVLANLLSLAINFLAGFAGLGKVADKVMGIIKKAQTVVDKGLDALVAWIVKMGKALFTKVFGKKEQAKKPSELTPEQRIEAALADASKLFAAPGADVAGVRPKLSQIQGTYGLKSLTLTVDSETDEYTEAHLDATINPAKSKGGRLPRDQKKAKIGPISFGSKGRPAWAKDTKVHLAEVFETEMLAGGKALSTVAKLVSKTTGTLKKAAKTRFDRRHIISFGDMDAHFKAAFPPTITVEEAVAVLTKLGIPCAYRKDEVVKAIKARVSAAFNEKLNLRLWYEEGNSSLQKNVDPTPAMLDKRGKVLQSRLDKHIERFLLTHGIPGVTFGVSQKRGEVAVEWEITGGP